MFPLFHNCPASQLCILQPGYSYNSLTAYYPRGAGAAANLSSHPRFDRGNHRDRGYSRLAQQRRSDTPPAPCGGGRDGDSTPNTPE